MGLCSHSRQEKKCGTISREFYNLLPVGKDLVKEDSGSDRGVPHTSDSERATSSGRDRTGHVRGITTKTLKGF